MDGNGRWAQEQGLPRVKGHQQGVVAVQSAIEAAVQHNIEILSLFAFGQDNWKRSSNEVRSLFELLWMSLKREMPQIIKNHIQLRFIGDLSRLDQPLRTNIERTQQLTAKHTGLKLIIAINYSGRWDIVNAARTLVQKVQQGEQAGSVTHEQFAEQLALSDLPDPDLLIRTSGEQRISNFMLWQFAYTEFYFTSIYWPEFNQQTFVEALQTFSKRQRRFGLESSAS